MSLIKLTIYINNILRNVHCTIDSIHFTWKCTKLSITIYYQNQFYVIIVNYNKLNLVSITEIRYWFFIYFNFFNYYL